MEEVIGKRIALVFASIVAVILIIWDAGLSDGIYTIGIAVMFAVYMRLTLNLLHWIIKVGQIKIDWYLLLILGVLYAGIMMYFDRQQTLTYVFIVGVLVGVGYFLIERIVFFWFRQE